MSLLKGPRVLALSLILLYGAFLAWYDSGGPVLTAAEVDDYIAQVRAKVEATGATPDETLLAELRQLCASDDGSEFFMLNLINFRAMAEYPPGSPYSGTGLEADARYSRAIAPLLFKRAAHPVFLGTPQGRFIDQAGDVQWQRIALVRYRSRRDLMEMVVDLAALPVGVHKWASIAKTQVFPTRSMFDLMLLRSGVAALLLVLGLGLSGLLYRLRT